MVVWCSPFRECTRFYIAVGSAYVNDDRGWKWKKDLNKPNLALIYAGTLVKTIPWWKQFASMVMRCKGTHRFGETHSQVGLLVPAESVLCIILLFR